MINSKKPGLMYTRNKVPKFQTGNAFSAEEVKPIGYQFGDANLFGKQPSIPFGMRAPRNPLDGYAASNNFNTGVAKQPQLQWIVFQAVLAQTSFKERLKNSAAGMFGKQAAHSIASP
jgi:hypothetical protein